MSANTPDLETALRAAVASGLVSWNLTRVGVSAIMWQASSRRHGDDAYRVAIKHDPVAALLSVIGPRVVPGASVSSAPAAGVADEPEDVFA